MAKQRYKYQCDNGNVFEIRLDSRTVAATGNESAAGSLTNPKIAILASRGANKYGLTPRKVNVRRLIGTVGTGANVRSVYQYASLVYCTPAGYAAALAANTIAYNGVDWEPVSGTGES